MNQSNKKKYYFIGIMSGTSLDGIDAVLVSYEDQELTHDFGAMVSLDLPINLKNTLLELQQPSINEWEKAQLAGNELAHLYAQAVYDLLKKTNKQPTDIIAIGVHGQTIRHQPQLGYTSQINNPSLLAELTNIDVIADFRSRDIAAKGQGAPLVPVYHELLAKKVEKHVAFVNIGGMSNVSFIDLEYNQITGHDCGPGNVLIDALCQKYLSVNYDKDGLFAKNGTINYEFIEYLKDNCPFLFAPPPKSTGREMFNIEWLEQMIHQFFNENNKNYSINSNIYNLIATITFFTATIIAQDIITYCKKVLSSLKTLIICGGGAYNPMLCQLIQQELNKQKCNIDVKTCESIDIPAQAIEGAAFAHLAYLFTHRKTANKPLVTGAVGARILGALYPH